MLVCCGRDFGKGRRVANVRVSEEHTACYGEEQCERRHGRESMLLQRDML